MISCWCRNWRSTPDMNRNQREFAFSNSVSLRISSLEHEICNSCFSFVNGDFTCRVSGGHGRGQLCYEDVWSVSPLHGMNFVASKADKSFKCFPFRKLLTYTTKIFLRKSKPRNCLRTIAKWLISKISRLKCSCRPSSPRRISILASDSKMLLKRSPEPSRGKCAPCRIRLAHRRRSTQPRQNTKIGATFTWRFEVKPFNDRLSRAF